MNLRPKKSEPPCDNPCRHPAAAPGARAELPRLTPLQFLVIRLLLDGRTSGRKLRRELGRWGAGMSKPAFSQMMRRLQVAGLVRSDRVSQDSAGLPIRYCVYQARLEGLKRWRAAADFYARLEEPPGAEKHLFDETIQQREDRAFADDFVRLGLDIDWGKHLLGEAQPEDDAR